MKYAVIRIIGNEIEGRHGPGSTIEILKYQLKNECEGESLHKIWFLNRIVDEQLENELLWLLRGREVDVIPFVPSEYVKATNVLDKVMYLTNINQARNKALLRGALFNCDYTIPLDGGCMFLTDGWRAFDASCRANVDDPVFMIPMWRVTSWESIPRDRPTLIEEWRIVNRESPGKLDSVLSRSEPQLAFHKSFVGQFDEMLVYGDCDKVDMLWRLGIPGVWDREELFSGRAKSQLKDIYPHIKQVKAAGYVCRLPSGVLEADINSFVRALNRGTGIYKLVRKADEYVGLR